MEYAKGLDYTLDKITAESKLQKGSTESVNYDYDTNPSNIFVHNHPTDGVELSFSDVFSAILHDVHKIFASTKSGYTSMDFSTVKAYSQRDALMFLVKARDEYQALMERIGLKSQESAELKEYHYNKLKEFAKLTGATFSDVKWSDYKRTK